MSSFVPVGKFGAVAAVVLSQGLIGCGGTESSNVGNSKAPAADLAAAQKAFDAGSKTVSDAGSYTVTTKKQDQESVAKVDTKQGLVLVTRSSADTASGGNAAATELFVRKDPVLLASKIADKWQPAPEGTTTAGVYESFLAWPFEGAKVTKVLQPSTDAQGECLNVEFQLPINKLIDQIRASVEKQGTSGKIVLKVLAKSKILGTSCLDDRGVLHQASFKVKLAKLKTSNKKAKQVLETLTKTGQQETGISYSNLGSTKVEVPEGL